MYHYGYAYPSPSQARSSFPYASYGKTAAEMQHEADMLAATQQHELGLAALDKSLGAVDSFLTAGVGFYTADQQREAADAMIREMGLNRESAAAIESQMEQYIQSYQLAQTGAATGDPNAQAEADALRIEMAALLATTKEEEGMSPGVIAAIAIGGVALLGGIVFMITRTGRSAHYPYHY